MGAEYVVVVPVKPPALAKSRLQGLTDEQRRDLAGAFAVDTATACLAADRVRHVLVTTDDATFAQRLGALGCHTMPDGATTGLNPALRQAVAEAHRRWPVLVPVALCADLPALRPGDLDEALGALVPSGASYVADADGTGTTLYTATYDEFDPRFGVDSSAAHLAAGALGVPGRLASLRRDVDDLTDLRGAVALGVGAETSRTLEALGLS